MDIGTNKISEFQIQENEALFFNQSMIGIKNTMWKKNPLSESALFSLVKVFALEMMERVCN